MVDCLHSIYMNNTLQFEMKWNEQSTKHTEHNFYHKKMPKINWILMELLLLCFVFVDAVAVTIAVTVAIALLEMCQKFLFTYDLLIIFQCF